jgi:hypothetical protein
MANGVSEQARQNECFLHGDEGREPWRPSFRDIEVVRCDHLGVAYVVEMYLIAGSEGSLVRSHHIHFVRDGLREVHALADDLSQDLVDRIWSRAVNAMERGEAPNCHEAHFHEQVGR